MTITVSISITGHMVVAVFITIFFYYSFHITFASSKNLSWSWFFTYWGEPNLHSYRVSLALLPEVGCYSFPLTFHHGMVILDALMDL